jgi:hypothetical protein
MRVIVVSILLWVASALVTFATGSSNLIPTIILLGKLMIPVTFAEPGHLLFVRWACWCAAQRGRRRLFDVAG